MTNAPLQRRRRPAFAMACVAVGVAMLMIATVPATASDAEATGRRFKPMTYNVYLGANLQPLFGVTNLDELIRRAAEVFAHVESVDFNVRAVALAREIIDADPDAVALQEMSLWRTAPRSNPGDITVRYDFLKILLDELARQGAGYRAAAVNPTFSGQLPISATTLGLFTDRNAIIVRSDVPASELSTANSAQGTYQAALTVPILDQTLAVRRGWASIDVHIRDRWYTVIDTHLEAFVPSIREAQVAELVTIIAAADHPVVLAGDLNVYPEGYRVVDAEEWQMFDAAGLEDSWMEAGEAPASTAGQSDDLDNVPSSLDNMVDFILHDSAGRVEAVDGSGHIVGEELDDRTNTVPPLWPSDHAGVVLTLRAAAA